MRRFASDWPRARSASMAFSIAAAASFSAATRSFELAVKSSALIRDFIACSPAYPPLSPAAAIRRRSTMDLRAPASAPAPSSSISSCRLRT